MDKGTNSKTSHGVKETPKRAKHMFQNGTGNATVSGEKTLMKRTRTKVAEYGMDGPK